ncbi:MAG: hypothetical protein WA126_07765, partial [Thermodesulfovibrionales bacterium]
FDEKMLEIGYGCDIVTLSEETERNREYKDQPTATTPVFYSTRQSMVRICVFVTITSCTPQNGQGVNPLREICGLCRL